MPEDAFQLRATFVVPTEVTTSPEGTPGTYWGSGFVAIPSVPEAEEGNEAFHATILK